MWKEKFWVAVIWLKNLGVIIRKQNIPFSSSHVLSRSSHQKFAYKHMQRITTWKIQHIFTKQLHGWRKALQMLVNINAHQELLVTRLFEIFHRTICLTFTRVVAVAPVLSRAVTRRSYCRVLLSSVVNRCRRNILPVADSMAK